MMATATAATATNSRSNSVVMERGLDQVVSETEQRRHSLVRDAATLLGVPSGKLCDLLRNVWTTSKGQQPLSDQEMFTGISLIARYQLDPITREIYVTRGKDGRLMTVIGIDGWVKILDRTEGYDGFDVELHQDDKGKVDWVETRIYSTKRTHPTSYRAYWSEYSTLTGFMGAKIPSHMLRIFSLRHAARLFTPLGASVVTEEEANAMMRAELPADRKQVERLDELTDQLMSRLAKPSDAQPDATHEEESSTPEPDREPMHIAQMQARLAECTQLRQVGEVEAELVAQVEDADSRGEIAVMADKQREFIRSTRGERTNGK